MRTKLANLNHCTVPFLSRAAVNLSCYDSTLGVMYITYIHKNPLQRTYIGYDV